MCSGSAISPAITAAPTAGGAFVVGAGANVMYGGSNNSVALQPLSVEGQVGLNVYAGVAGLELRFGQ